MINWDELLANLPVDAVQSFARGNVSGRQLYDMARNTPVGGQVRNLLRRKTGVDGARGATRKALRRRGLEV
jgi:hypothetical protein